MRTRFKSLLALGLTFAAGCFVGIDRKSVV